MAKKTPKNKWKFFKGESGRTSTGTYWFVFWNTNGKARFSHKTVTIPKKGPIKIEYLANILAVRLTL